MHHEKVTSLINPSASDVLPLIKSFITLSGFVPIYFVTELNVIVTVINPSESGKEHTTPE